MSRSRQDHLELLLGLLYDLKPLKMTTEDHFFWMNINLVNVGDRWLLFVYLIDGMVGSTPFKFGTFHCLAQPVQERPTDELMIEMSANLCLHGDLPAAGT